MRLVKKFLNIIFYFILFIVVVNVVFLTLIHFKVEPVYQFYREGVIIELASIDTVYIFAHGHYEFFYDDKIENYISIKHITTYNGKEGYTLNLVEHFKDRGFTKIWLSQCDTGDYDELFYDLKANKTVLWDDFPEVDRYDKPDGTMVYFTGFGFIRTKKIETFI